MDYFLTRRFDETFTAQWVGTETLNAANPLLKLETTGSVDSVLSFTSVGETITGENDNISVKKFFRYKDTSCGTEWSDEIPLDQLTGMTISGETNIALQVLYYYVYDDPTQPATDVTISNVTISGTYEFSTTDEIIALTGATSIILKPKDIYKIFKLTDFQIVGSNLNTSNYDIKYRFTQDGGRTYSKWEPLTTENISTYRFDELRFAQVEYLITNYGGSLVIYDILLVGDFQNVSANYLKSNRYGLKEDCSSLMQTSLGNNSFYANFDTQGMSCYSSGTAIEDIKNSQNPSTLWNPYAASAQITDFAALLASHVSNMFGFTVNYYLTDPDKNGIDRYLHEYTLKNVIDMQPVKILIPDNNFPDNQIVINEFGLGLFDTFEVHITKDEFKNRFGIEKRPGEDDILYICETNRLYYVKHAQVYRSIMNAGLYYKVILEKYEKRADIQFKSQAAKDSIENLTKNTTIEDVLGLDSSDKNIRQEEKQIANKDQLYPTSFDKVRHQISKYVDIYDEKIKNYEIDFINHYYDLSSSFIKNKTAVNYTKIDYDLTKGENRSFILWVNFKNQYKDESSLTTPVYNSYSVQNGTYYFLHNYDENPQSGFTGSGYKIFYERTNTNSRFVFMLNDKTYMLPFIPLTNVWYGLVVNLDQRQREVNMQLYKRDLITDVIMFNLQTQQKVYVNSTDTTGITSYIAQNFRSANNIEMDRQNLANLDYVVIKEMFGNSGKTTDDVTQIYTGNTFMLLTSAKTYNVDPEIFTHTKNINIKGSNVNITNIRIFNDIIQENETSNILNQLIIHNTQYLIMADNANRKLTANNIKNLNFR
jgi:hypothetical protein